MSQGNPEPKSERRPAGSRFRWIWLPLLALMLSVPVLILTVLFTAYLSQESRNQTVLDQMSRERANEEYQLKLARERQQQDIAVARAQSVIQRVQSHVVQLKVSFEDLETRFTTALIVERNGNTSTLTAPRDVFAPITGKVNGRVVTVSPSTVNVVGGWGGPGSPGGPSSAMGMMPPGMPGMAGGSAMAEPFGILVKQQFPHLGLLTLSANTSLSPLRVLGDFPKAVVGEKLMVITTESAKPGSFAEVAVLAMDESVNTAPDTKLDHLLKLTEWNGEMGAVACNSQGDPIGQIVATVAIGKLKYSFAVPMDRLFEAVYQADVVIGDKKVEADLNGAVEEDPFVPGSKRAMSIHADAAPPQLPDLKIEVGEAARVPPTDDTPPILPSSRTKSDLEVRPDVEAKVAPQTAGANELRTYPDDSFNPMADDSTDIGRVYSVEGVRDDAVKALRDQFGNSVKLWIDPVTRSIIVIASEATHQQVATVVERMNQQVHGARSADEARRAKELLLKYPVRRGEDLGPDGPAIIPENAAALPPTDSPPGDSAIEMMTGMMSGMGNRGATPDELDRKLDREARQLALRLRSASPTESPVLRQELEELTQRHFDLRQRNRKQEIDELGSRVDKLRLSHLRREQNKSEVIQRRIQELLDPNADLRWDESSAPAPGVSGPAPGNISNMEGSTTLDSAPDSIDPLVTLVRNPGTFDGVPYAQWLTLLETERKPGKLALAIEACSRLASNDDEHRIAQGILRAVHLFEAAEDEERDVVWLPAVQGLYRLPAAVVADELIRALRQHDRDHGLFPAFFLSQDSQISTRIAATHKDQELIAELLKVSASEAAHANQFLAAACRIWQSTDRPLDDYEGLRPAIVKLIDEGLSTDRSWQIVVDAVVTKDPQLPDLSLKLWKYHVNSDVYRYIGRMKQRAEPVVPHIVNSFVVNWRIEEEKRLSLPPVGRLMQHRSPSQFSIVQIQTLGEIGVGSKGWQLLSELNSIRMNLSSRERAVLDAAMAMFHGDREVNSPTMLLSDFTMISGSWRLKGYRNGEVPPDYRLTFNRSVGSIERADASPKLELPNGAGDLFTHFGGQKFEFDTKSSPKKITLINQGFGIASPETRHVGIYVLTPTTLRLQFAVDRNQPPPAELATPTSLIPEGQFLLEFVRAEPDEPTANTAPRALK
ncbi:MAG: hypothetical protein JSS49_19650 [Planctomycetes bacterium]|nr:hypothetical protein [Planctomycetota bacterium]